MLLAISIIAFIIILILIVWVLVSQEKPVPRQPPAPAFEKPAPRQPAGPVFRPANHNKGQPQGRLNAPPGPGIFLPKRPQPEPFILRQPKVPNRNGANTNGENTNGAFNGTGKRVRRPVNARCWVTGEPKATCSCPDCVKERKTTGV
jgi:hypothetical protein